VQVTLDSLFMFSPSWQFNVIVHNGSPDPLIIDPQRAGLYVRDASGSTRLDGPTSAGLQVVPPGADSAGVLEFDQQDSADGRVLSLVYGSGGRAVRFAFPLQGLVTSVPAPAPPAGGSATGPTV
jgi:hypothetical protein